MRRLASVALATALVLAETPNPDYGLIFQSKIKDGTLRYQVSTPEEVDQAIGKPDAIRVQADGGMDMSFQSHGALDLKYGRFREWGNQPFVLAGASWKGAKLPSPQGPLRLLKVEELTRLNPFDGLRHTDLAALDLRNAGPALAPLPFGSDTQWPPTDRRPPAFDPERRLSLGQNPGLGLRALHARKIDGRGVRIAIIDQPLLRNHPEYQGALERVESLGVDGVPPQMHASCVASIAVGAQGGVAPGARLIFLETATWEEANRNYALALRRLLAMNRETNDPSQKIRAVSISDGAFHEQPDPELWQEALKEAEAAGVLVLTCDDHRPYGTLRRKPEADPDAPASYEPGVYDRKSAPISVPTGGRTLAGHELRDPYYFDPDGGLSWGAPYLLGLAALVYQVNPRLDPETVWNLMAQTSRKTSAGMVPDPAALVQAARALP